MGINVNCISLLGSSFDGILGISAGLDLLWGTFASEGIGGGESVNSVNLDGLSGSDEGDEGEEFHFVLLFIIINNLL